MRIREAARRWVDALVRIGLGWAIGAQAAPLLDGGLADWHSWLGGAAFGASMLLFWGGVARIPLPHLPRGLRAWFEQQRAEAWSRRHAHLNEAGAHEVLMPVLGDRWIHVIKALRRATGMTLAEAKDATAEPQSPVVSNRSEASAELIAAMLREAGVTAVVRPMAP